MKTIAVIFSILMLAFPGTIRPVGHGSLGAQDCRPLQLPDTVQGDFDGDGKKEYVNHKRKDKDAFCLCTIFFSDNKIPPIEDTGVFVSAIRNEGDLDERPGDELLIIWGSCEASEWMGGNVYTCRKGKWITLTDGISLYGVNDSEDYVKKDPDHPGYILVTSDVWVGKDLAAKTKSVKVK